MSADFYAYLRSQFSTLDEAKLFVRRWIDEMNQDIPGFGMCSSRAMSYHCSMVLQGKDHDPSDGRLTNYLDTQYGAELYEAMWSAP